MFGSILGVIEEVFKGQLLLRISREGKRQVTRVRVSAGSVCACVMVNRAGDCDDDGNDACKDWLRDTSRLVDRQIDHLLKKKEVEIGV